MNKDPCKSIIRRYFGSKFVWVSILFLVILISGTIVISMTAMPEVTSTVTQLNGWVLAHRYAFLLWHGLIALAIWHYWGKKVDKDAVQYNLAPRAIKQTKRFRYIMISLILLIDIVIRL